MTGAAWCRYVYNQTKQLVHLSKTRVLASYRCDCGVRVQSWEPKCVDVKDTMPPWSACHWKCCVP